MNISLIWSRFKYHALLDVGPISEVSRKHRRALLFSSVCMLFLDPTVKITFGKASLGGFGITIEPVQTISLTLALFLVLIYFLLNFWVAVMIDIGTDLDRARKRARECFSPDHDSRYPSSMDLESQVKEHSNNRVYIWNTRRVVWEVFFPSAIALGALLRFIYFQLV